MKVQTNHFISKIITIITEYSDFQMIAIFFIFFESLDFEKKNIKRELIFSEKIMSFFLLTVSVFLMKNLFLTDSSVFHFLISSVISVIQFSVFLEALFSDFSESASSVLSFIISLLIF